MQRILPIAVAVTLLAACGESPVLEPDLEGPATSRIDAGAMGSTVAGNAVFTAANGDQLFTTVSGTATFPDANGIVTFSGTDTVTGGTGRFAGASGSLTRTARVSVLVLSGQYEFSGTLSY